MTASTGPRVGHLVDEEVWERMSETTPPMSREV
jgi:hypothetical protein